MGNLGQAFVEILPNLKRWGAKLRADLAKASNPPLVEGERKFNGFVSRIKDGLFSLKGAMGLAFGSAAVGIVAKFGLGTAAALQQAQISFETMLGSAKVARDFLDDLKTFAASTPFELPGLVGMARQLVGAGAAAKDVIPTLTAYGNAAGALGLNQEQFGRVMLAVTQTMNKGKIQAEELLQITEAGLPIYPLLAKALGMPVAKIQELSSKGQLLAKDVLPKLQAQMQKDYGGSMIKQSQTLSGLWSTLKDTFQLGLADALQPLVPVLSTVMPGAISTLGTAFKVASTSIAAFIAALSGEGITSDGVVGGAERLGVAVRNLGIYAVETGQVLRGYYRDHQLLIETTTAAVVTMFAAFKLYQGAVTALAAVRVAMLAFRASVISTTIAMYANPIGIVVLAIVGLIAALVVLYKRNEAFRRIVLQVWAAVKSAIGTTIAFLTPYWNSFVEAMKDVGEWSVRMYQQYIVPAFAAIKVAVSVLINYVQFYFKLWVAAVKVVAAIVGWLWRNVVSPTFTAVAIAAKVLWAALQIAFGAIRIQLKLAGAAFQLLWTVIRPVLSGIGTAIKFLYNAFVRPLFQGIGKIISFTWNSVIKPALSAMGDFVSNRLAPAFRVGVNAIRRAWDEVKEAAKEPVRFVVNTVINRGIIDTWNKIAGFFGVNKVGHVTLPKGFASGGKFSSPTAIVGEGKTSRPEYVIPTDPKHRSRALSLYSDLGTKLMAGGGILGDTLDFFTDPAATAKRIFKSSLGRLSGLANNPFAQLVGRVPAKMVEGMIGFMTRRSSAVFGGGDLGGLGWQRQMAVLRARFPGLPLISGYRPGAITATGNPSWHGKGRAVDIPPRMDVFNWIAQNFGKRTKELIFTPAGIKQVLNGASHVYSGITAAMHKDHIHWAYDRGGLLPPGLSMAYNGTGRGERVLPPSQDLETTLYRAFMRALADAGVGTVELRVDGEEFKKVIRVESKKQVDASASSLKVGRR